MLPAGDYNRLYKSCCSGSGKISERWHMPLMQILLILWGVLTTLLVLLLIYRSTLTIKEDDQLFLDDSESHMQAEQTELLARMKQIQPFVRLLGACSGLLIVVICGLWLYQGIAQNRL